MCLKYGDRKANNADPGQSAFLAVVEYVSKFAHVCVDYLNT